MTKRLSSSTIADEIERYLRTGDADMMGHPWPGDIMECGRRQHADIRGALLAEVRRLSKGRTHEAVPENVGVAFTRAKVEEMVRGLFPKAEKDVVTSTLARNDPRLLVKNDPLSFASMAARSATAVMFGVRLVVGDGRGRCVQEASVLHLPAMVSA